MKALSGIRDVDLKILQELEDHEINRVCQVNRYVSNLCNDETFWLNRLLNKNYDLEDLKNIKGTLTYKQIYRYIHLGDFKTGILEAIKTDNVYLYKNVKNPQFLHVNRDKIIMEASDKGSIDILVYIWKGLAEDEIDRDIDIIYSIGNQKTLDWIFKMDFGNYLSFLEFLIYENLEGHIDEYKSYIYDQIKKYFSKIHNSNDLEDLFYTLGLSLNNESLESRKKILDIFLLHIRDKKYLNFAINGAKDARDFNSWKEYILSKMKV